MMKGPWNLEWDVLEELDGGGQSFTYKLISKSDKNQLAVLKILKNVSSDIARNRLGHEIKNMSDVHSAGGSVPQILEQGNDSESDSPYFVMSYCDGQTLHKYIDVNKRLKLNDAVFLAHKLLEVLEIAHGLTVYHRDIKPDNIILLNNDILKPVLLDFGLSHNEKNDSDDTRLTEQFRNSFLALPEYNVPTTTKRDYRSDLTAVSGIVFYCITGLKPGQLIDGDGRMPHQRSEVDLSKIIRDKDERMRFAKFLDKGLSLRIINRYQSIDAVRSALNLLSKSDDALSVIEKANRISEDLERVHRPTVIARLRSEAAPVIDEIQNIHKGYDKSLGAFEFKLRGEKIQENTKNPTGQDTVLKINFELHFQHTGFTGGVCRRIYRVFAEDVTVTMFSSDGFSLPSNMLVIEHWEHVATYDGPVEQIFSLLRDNIDQWISASIDELTRQISTSNSPLSVTK